MSCDRFDLDATSQLSITTWPKFKMSEVDDLSLIRANPAQALTTESSEPQDTREDASNDDEVGLFDFVHYCV